MFQEELNNINGPSIVASKEWTNIWVHLEKVPNKCWSVQTQSTSFLNNNHNLQRTSKSGIRPARFCPLPTITNQVFSSLISERQIWRRHQSCPQIQAKLIHTGIFFGVLTRTSPNCLVTNADEAHRALFPVGGLAPNWGASRGRRSWRSRWRRSRRQRCCSSRYCFRPHHPSHSQGFWKFSVYM